MKSTSSSMRARAGLAPGERSSIRLHAAFRRLLMTGIMLVFCIHAGAVQAFSEGGFDFLSQPASKATKPSQPASSKSQGQINTDRLPRSIAILPFDNASDDPNIAEEVRRAFYNQFSSKPYADIELNAVDARLHALERSGQGKPDHRLFCKTLGCDGVITGRVIDFRKIFAGVYSELAVSAEISLINAETGEIVLTQREDATFREGGISLTPVGLIMNAMSAALNLRDIQRVRLVNEVGYSIAKVIPDPVGGGVSSGPRIQGMLSNSSESPFGLGKVISVAIQADPNGSAVFDIGHYRRALPMTEKSPGLYVGEYRIQDGDSIRLAPVVATLRARNGLVASWYDTHLINIDSQPPLAPARLSARSQPGKIELRWDALTDISDLAGYQVLRSVQPLTGFAPIGVVDVPEFVDQDNQGQQNDGFRYYRIVALDHAGNASEPSSIARGRVLPLSAPQISGRIDADRELAGNVVVTGDLLIPAGVSLQLAPGTRLEFAPEARLIVKGGISSDSLKEPVELMAKAGGHWGGILVEGGSVGLRGFSLIGAKTGITLKHAQGILESGLIHRCDTGVLVSGASAASLRELRIADNRLGVRLERSDAEFSLNRITSNQIGVELDSYSGIMRDNAIFQNQVNLRANAGTLLDANYWGSLDPAALRIEGGVVTEALNRPPPDGKLVALRVSPCRGLSAEACQAKSTEAMIEAGRLFRAKNYGRALTQFEASIAAIPSADAYYFAALCHQEMQEIEPAIERLRDGVASFPNDPALRRALGMLYFQRGDQDLAREHIGQALRLSPNDRQAAFVLERLGGHKDND